MISTLEISSSPLFLEHECKGHVENATRLSTVLDGIKKHPKLSQFQINSPRPALDSEILKVHTNELLSQLKETAGHSGFLDPDTYYSPKSLDAALAAAGGTVDLAKRIWKQEVKRGFSLVRPPGHHATREESMGFCLLNNVAIATQAVLEEDPRAKIAIIDFDLHHGNGTQWIFYDNPQVLFLSSHRFPFYPGTGSLKEVGEGKGKGLTANFPLAERYPGPFFLDLYGSVVQSILQEFSPDMIVVSAGFDGHSEDPMHGFQIETEDYRFLARILIEAAEKTAKGRILYSLEGGYHPESLRDSVLVSLEEMLQPQSYFHKTSSFGLLVDGFRKHYSNYFKL